MTKPIRPTTPTSKRLTLCVSTAIVAWAVMLVSSVALADEAGKYRDQINQYSQRVTELRTLEQAAALSTELQQIEGWLDEALVQLGKEEFTSVIALLRRAEVQLDYTTATIGWKAETGRADTKEAELNKAREDLRVLKDELEQLKVKETALQNQVSRKQGTK